MTASAGFVSAAARRRYWLFSLGALLLYVTNATLAVLSLALKKQGFTEASIGLVLSAPALPVLAAMLASGFIVRRFGSLTTSLAAILVMIVGYASFQLSSTDATLAAGSRVLYGLGAGIFMPSSMVYVQ